MERLKTNGVEHLTSVELLAILIRTGDRNRCALDLARDLFNFAGRSWNTLGAMSLHDICQIKGIGEGKAMNIISALEAGKRFLKEGLGAPVQSLNSAEDVFKMLLPQMKGLPHEEFWIVLLGESNRVLGMERLSIGGATATIIDQKFVLKKALEKNARGIVMVHNHPSGSPFPSEADIQQTTMLKDSCAPFGIDIVDHVIMTSDAFFSFADAAVRRPAAEDLQ